MFASLNGRNRKLLVKSFGRKEPSVSSHSMRTRIDSSPVPSPRHDLRVLTTNRNMKRWCTKPGASAANRPVSKSTASALTRACPAPRSVTASPVGTPSPTPVASSIAPWPKSRLSRHIPRRDQRRRRHRGAGWGLGRGWQRQHRPLWHIMRGGCGRPLAMEMGRQQCRHTESEFAMGPWSVLLL